MGSTSGMGELGTGKEGENGISERKETERKKKIPERITATLILHCLWRERDLFNYLVLVVYRS